MGHSYSIISKEAEVIVMRKSLSFLCIFTFVFSLTACGSQSGTGSTSEAEPSASQPVHSQEPEQTESSGQLSEESNEEPAETKQESTESADTEAVNEPQEADGPHVLVAYFSATGTTKALAEYAADAMGADIYEIVPEEPYTDADLNYNDDNSRSTIEMNDPSARPAISSSVENMEQYDIVFIGYPIWWGDAPRIVSTFVENYDFSGKTVIPFCTSGGSGIGSSGNNLEQLTSGADWLDGRRLDGGASREDIVSWINGLGLEITAQ